MYEQIELPYPNIDQSDCIIDGLDDGAKLTIPQRLQTAVLALAITPPGQPFPPAPVAGSGYRVPYMLPLGTQVFGTGFRFHETGLFVTAAHGFAAEEWSQLIRDRRLVGICSIPGGPWTPLPVLAICHDHCCDLAVGLLPHPQNPDDRHLVGDVPVSFEALPPSATGMLFAAGFQDTQQNYERINLNPILFRGHGYRIVNGPHRFRTGHRELEIHKPMIQVPMKVRVGLSGAPLLVFSGPDQQIELTDGKAYGVMSYIKVPDEEMTEAHFVPVHHAFDIPLDHEGFGLVRGKTFNEAFKHM